jgi:hypothetical protein
MNKLNELFGTPLVISLARRTDRRDAFDDNARQHKLDFQFFDAIEPPPQGEETAFTCGMTAIIDAGVLGPNYGISTHYKRYGARVNGEIETKAEKEKERLGITGCRLSHLEAMYRGNFIIEDDVLLRDDWDSNLACFERIPEYDELLLKSKGRDASCSPIDKDWMRYEYTTACGWAYVVTNRGRDIKAKFILNGPGAKHWDVWLAESGYYKEAKVITPRLADLFAHDHMKLGSDTDGDRIRPTKRASKLKPISVF